MKMTNERENKHEENQHNTDRIFKMSLTMINFQHLHLLRKQTSTFKEVKKKLTKLETKSLESIYTTEIKEK